MNRDLLKGSWRFFKDEQEFSKERRRATRGEFKGAGWYLCVEYLERCPRNCCYDECLDKLHSEDVVEEVRKTMREWASLLKTAREYS